MMKEALRAAAYQLGALQLLQSYNGDWARILMYHRFAQADARNFEQQCAFLQARYKVVSLDVLLRSLREGRSTKNLLAITIDDGYADVHDVALPVLKKYKLPATLFVTSGFIDGAWMPGDASRYFFSEERGLTLEVEDDAGTLHVFHDSCAKDEPTLRALLKRMPNRRCRQTLDTLQSMRLASGVARSVPQYEPCTWEQLRALADNGVQIGGHTRTHPILSRVEDPGTLEDEIAGSKQELEARLERSIEYFAYPNGTPEDISLQATQCVRRHFRGAVTASPGMNGPATDHFQLLRLPADPFLPVPQLARMLAGPVRLHASRQDLTPHLVSH